MGGLGGAARIDPVHLRGHLIGGSQPGLGHGSKGVVGKIRGKAFGIGQTVFFKHVPNSVIGTGFGKMVCSGCPSGFFSGDDGLKDCGGTVNRCRVWKGAFDRNNARTVEQNIGPFAHQRLAIVVCQARPVVEWYIVLNVTGARIVRCLRLSFGPGL